MSSPNTNITYTPNHKASRRQGGAEHLAESPSPIDRQYYHTFHQGHQNQGGNSNASSSSMMMHQAAGPLFTGGDGGDEHNHPSSLNVSNSSSLLHHQHSHNGSRNGGGVAVVVAPPPATFSSSSYSFYTGGGGGGGGVGPEQEHHRSSSSFISNRSVSGGGGGSLHNSQILTEQLEPVLAPHMRKKKPVWSQLLQKDGGGGGGGVNSGSGSPPPPDRQREQGDPRSASNGSSSSNNNNIARKDGSKLTKKDEEFLDKWKDFLASKSPHHETPYPSSSSISSPAFFFNQTFRRRVDGEDPSEMINGGDGVNPSSSKFNYSGSRQSTSLSPPRQHSSPASSSTSAIHYGSALAGVVRSGNGDLVTTDYGPTFTSKSTTSELMSTIMHLREENNRLHLRIERERSDANDRMSEYSSKMEAHVDILLAQKENQATGLKEEISGYQATITELYNLMNTLRKEHQEICNKKFEAENSHKEKEAHLLSVIDQMETAVNASCSDDVSEQDKAGFLKLETELKSAKRELDIKTEHHESTVSRLEMEIGMLRAEMESKENFYCKDLATLRSDFESERTQFWSDKNEMEKKWSVQKAALLEMAENAVEFAQSVAMEAAGVKEEEEVGVVSSSALGSESGGAGSLLEPSTTSTTSSQKQQQHQHYVSPQQQQQQQSTSPQQNSSGILISPIQSPSRNLMSPPDSSSAS